MRSPEEARTQLKMYTDLICSEDATFLQIRDTLYAIHALFVEMGAIDVDVLQSTDSPQWLNSGCAIAPTAAGRCLFEIARTRQFVRGIREAIDQLLLSERRRPLQILEAGCGPYALLSLLPALYTRPGEVVFHLLDIFPENLLSARTLIQNLGMQEYFGDYIQADACTYQWQRKEPLDILLVEVMLQALRKEPQVAVTLNLSPQLAPGGILIPQQVDVSLVMAEKGTRWKEVQTPEGVMLVDREEEVEETLAHIVSLSKQSTRQYFEAAELARIILPPHFNPSLYDLQLHTRIQVFGTHLLQRNDTSLTLPQTILRKEKINMEPGTVLSLRYALDENPHIATTVIAPSAAKASL